MKLLNMHKIFCFYGIKSGLHFDVNSPLIKLQRKTRVFYVNRKLKSESWYKIRSKPSSIDITFIASKGLSCNDRTVSILSFYQWNVLTLRQHLLVVTNDLNEFCNEWCHHWHPIPRTWLPNSLPTRAAKKMKGHLVKVAISHYQLGV